ncbi:GNAT family N-acetyltransferase [Streptomyces sp. NPDC047049]|uniref:GNAT family N-acetyltransferase n=1 Tax=Streptomyces sp. NPDC047049 TaxID=3156688 RepID=UPI003402E80A
MDRTVTVRDLDQRDELEELRALLARIWNSPEPLLSFPVLRALSHAGGMVLGAYVGDRMVGGAVGFRHPDAPSLHSHIVGVDPDHQGKGVGRTVKLYQRDWCLRRGITEITWTFDPLVWRNAVFNIDRIGAVGVRYLPDFYGPMVHGSDAEPPTDRMLLSWDLSTDRRPEAPGPRGAAVLDVGPDGEPRNGVDPDDGRPVWLRLPERVAPAQAVPWRHALRAVLAPLLDAGHRWTAVADGGWCVLTRPDAEPHPGAQGQPQELPEHPMEENR